ncbi:MAG: hypothetical protein F4139_10380 [Gemmatimonadetes bacterium]|nr:hypothetical protein [Gemmatimonadota bacterium]MYA63391.1 hypothetical protein [Gemmatimonadota bacterium]MYB97580.1 hypothetical protein [Gemmatimonadota bacterium]MYH53342.1 hypothetical protein [Gemmatimonadota bacterium]MYI45938.1 hypothetical protein [Gemmatimonadota bacterium]
MKNFTKLPKRLATSVAVVLVALGGSGEFGTGLKPAAAESAQWRWIHFLYPSLSCITPCPFYWLEGGCICVQLPPIIVKG